MIWEVVHILHDLTMKLSYLTAMWCSRSKLEMDLDTVHVKCKIHPPNEKR